MIVVGVGVELVTLTTFTGSLTVFLVMFRQDGVNLGDRISLFEQSWSSVNCGGNPKEYRYVRVRVLKIPLKTPFFPVNLRSRLLRLSLWIRKTGSTRPDYEVPRDSRNPSIPTFLLSNLESVSFSPGRRQHLLWRLLSFPRRVNLSFIDIS